MTDTASRVEQFHRDGFLVVPDALGPEQVHALAAGLQRAFASPSDEAALYHMPDMWRPKMFERGREFEDVIDNPGVIDLIEAIVGADCHIIAASALRTAPGTGISFWHADDAVRFPRPADVPLDPRIAMPCFIVNLNYYLCDVDEELGPTQFVPGSHRSGRQPRDPEDYASADSPIYEGRGVVSALGKAGTCVLWHDQVWHRGAVNRSKDRIRWVQQVPYGRRFIAQRFYPFVNYKMPEDILARSSARRQRLLGKHGIGAYG